MSESEKNQTWEADTSSSSSSYHVLRVTMKLARYPGDVWGGVWASNTLGLCVWRDQLADDRSHERSGQQLGDASCPHGQIEPWEATYNWLLVSASDLRSANRARCLLGTTSATGDWVECSINNRTRHLLRAASAVCVAVRARRAGDSAGFWAAACSAHLQA